jgi:hypothetical protein
MCKSNPGGSSRLRSLSVLCLLLALAIWSQPALGQSSMPISMPPSATQLPLDAAWNAFFPAFNSLGTKIDSSVSNSQQAAIQSTDFQQLWLNEIAARAQDKQTYNESLAKLQTQLDAASQTQQAQSNSISSVATSSTESIDSLTEVQTGLRQAQADAKALERQTLWLKVYAVALTTVAGTLAVYDYGRHMFWW